MNEKCLFGIGIVLAVLLVFVAPAVADNIVYFNPDPSSAVPGEVITVELRFNHTEGVAAFNDDVHFDPSVVNITDGSPGIQPAMWLFVHYGDFVRFGGWSADYHNYPPGDHVLAYLTVEGVGGGTSILWHDDNDVFDELTGGGVIIPNQTWHNGTFTCEGEVPAKTYTKNLVTGWNLISLPLTNETDMTVANILGASLSSSYDALHKYDATKHSFVSLESSDTMENGVGYFIHMTVDDTWTYQGTACTTMTASLEQGLNCVGWTNTSASLPGALNLIAGSYRYVARWNVTAQSYEVYLPDAPSVFNNFETMKRGEGYFIAAKTSCTLTYP